MLYPLTFKPLFKERIWGGRRLEELYQKPLPEGLTIGESWELSDRPGDVSVIANGPLAGNDLHWLMERHGAELLGNERPHAGRFPLLIKLLDAREKLSLQVHPPAQQALELSGEPKTELWYIAEAEPGAELYVGLKRGVTKAFFEQKVTDGTVADCFHRVAVRAGDAMFLPSGRVHAIGKGLVIFEIQQNSDTTYRVFDWNRVGLEGKPRPLHHRESLASIDFEDFEPDLVPTGFVAQGSGKRRVLSANPLFTVEEWVVESGASRSKPSGVMQVIATVSGNLQIRGGDQTIALLPGSFCLIPASTNDVQIMPVQSCRFLTIEAGQGRE